MANAPGGTPLAAVVSHVFGAAHGDYSNTDYQLARRFFERHDEFEIERRSGDVWVWPTPDAFYLTRSKQSVGTQDGGGVAVSNAESVLGKVQSIESDSLRGSLLRALAAKREATEDKYTIMERVRGDGPEYVLHPFSTRFNSPDRVGSLRARYTETWEGASEEFDRGVMLTMTTDPSNFESIADAAESLMETKNDLGRWLSYSPESGPSRPGYRPPSIAVPEFTERGYPHLHVVYFGVSWLTTHGALSSYLAEKQGRVVHFDRVANRSGTWVFAGRHRRGEWSEDESAPSVMADGGVSKGSDYGGEREREPRGSVQGYLSKVLRSLAALADASPSEVHERAESLASGDLVGRESWWKLALYWATDMRIFTRSPSLRRDENDRESSSLPHIPCYRFVGSAEYNRIPGYIREKATVLIRSGGLLRPPPRDSSPLGVLPSVEEYQPYCHESEGEKDT